MHRIAFALAACVGLVALAPGAVLLFAPLLLGLPHVLAELRVLDRVARPRSAVLIAVLLPLVAMFALRVAEALGAQRPAASDVVLGGAAVLAAALMGPSARDARLARGLVVGGLAVIALQDTRLTAVLMAHLHNFVALAFVLTWLDAQRRATVARALLCCLAAALLALLLRGLPEETAFLRGVRLALAPAIPEDWGLRLVLVYAFAQLVHYIAWLAWIPRLQRVAAPRRGRMGAVAIVALGSMLLVPLLAATSDPIRIRDGYLALSGFHGWLELSVLAYGGLNSRVA